MTDLFTPRPMEDIAEGMLDFIAGDPDMPDSVVPTDLVPGSLELAHVEAVAVEIESLEVRAAQAIDAAIPEACFEAFGHGLIPAKPASGAVVFTAVTLPASDIAIPAGFQLMTMDGVGFRTVAAAVLPASGGISRPVPIEASEPGPGGNVPAGAIVRMPSPIAGVDLVANPSATVGGAQAEDAGARARRFQALLQSMPRGTADALEFAAMSTGLLTGVLAFDPCELVPRPIGVPFSGLVWLFCDDGGDGAALNPVVASTVDRVVRGYTLPDGARVPGWKAAGIPVVLHAVAKVPVSCRGRVRLVPGAEGRWAEVTAALDAALLASVSAVRPGGVLGYSWLCASLQSCHPDIVGVDLWLWKASGPSPDFQQPPVASDVSPVGADPLSNGWRVVLDARPSSWVLA